MSKKKVRNPFNMERDNSILNSAHYVLSVSLVHKYDPTAIEQMRPFAESAKRKAYKQMQYINANTTTNFESFSSYVDVVPTYKTKGRWDKYIDNGEIDMIRYALTR